MIKATLVNIVSIALSLSHVYGRLGQSIERQGEPSLSDKIVTIGNFLRDNSDLSRFTAGLDAFGYMQTLSDPSIQPMTLFIPTNEAIARLPSEIQSRLMNDREFANQMMQLHMSPQVLSHPQLELALRREAILPSLVGNVPIFLYPKRSQLGLGQDILRNLLIANEAPVQRVLPFQNGVVVLLESLMKPRMSEFEDRDSMEQMNGKKMTF